MESSIHVTILGPMSSSIVSSMESFSNTATMQAKWNNETSSSNQKRDTESVDFALPGGGIFPLKA
ncbi:hypothetical protein CR513_57890, partial [Mucuna pruriens]